MEISSLLENQLQINRCRYPTAFPAMQQVFIKQGGLALMSFHRRPRRAAPHP
ncbi:MAG: hypothetical protein V3V31_00390 [Methylococcales bacterium]